ncbi:Carbon-nitrogen hydrolase, partial [Dispira simplex]
MVTAAVAQICSVAHVPTNLAMCTNLIIQAAQRGAKIVFFPEASDFIAADTPETLRLSQTLDGPFVTRIRSAAQMNGVWISIGVHEV